MAHLLEHLIFKGTPTTRNAWAEFSRRGLRANGTTWYDRTNYFASFAANDDNLRWYLAGRPTRWSTASSREGPRHRDDGGAQRVRARREQPQPRAAAEDAGRHVPWHNYGKSTIGARTDIENVDIPRLQAFYRKYYQPDNATLIVAGKFDSAQVLAWVAAVLRAIPRPQRVLAPTYTLDPAQDGERRSPCAASAARRSSTCRLPRAARHRTPTSPPCRCSPRCWATRPAGGCTSAWSKGKLAASASRFAWGLAEPGPLILGAAAGAGTGRGPGARRDAGHRRRLAPSPSPPRSWSARAPAGSTTGSAASPTPSAWACAVRGHRAGRLAAVLPAARPRAPAHAGRTCSASHAVAAARQPHRGHLFADGAAERAPAAAARGRGGPGEGLPGRCRRGAGRGLRPHAGQPGWRARSASSWPAA
jgi:hypothetical protein